MKIFRSLLLKAGLFPSSYGMGSDAQEVELDDAGASRFVNDISAAVERLSKTNEEQTAVLNILFGEGAKDKASAEALKAAAAQGDTYVNDLRTDAVKFAKLAEGTDKLSEALERAIMSAPVDDAKKLRDEYKLKAEERNPLKCSKCGGTMSRGSADRGNEHGADDEIDISAYDIP